MESKQLRILAIGAHPDDCEYHFGGTAALYLAAGHAVKFVTVTNGNAGHQTLGRTELAAVRAKECALVSEITGVEYEILPNDDGGLIASLNTREQVVSVIRRFKPDLVFTHRTNDYHADHRTTGLLVQDSAFLLGVPAVCPTVPCLRYMPVVLNFSDNFTRPLEFRADVAVDIKSTIGEKAKMLHCHHSQFYEWLPWIEGEEDQVPSSEEAKLLWVEGKAKARDTRTAQRCREKLIECYGMEHGNLVEYAEAFEVSEYGSMLTKEKKNEYFPF